MLVLEIGILFLVLGTYSAENTHSGHHGHRTYQVKSEANELGAYNFAYDTGTAAKDGHSMRMEYRDEFGIVRGRYGYTDPNGKLRVVEYEAGPSGFHAKGDVGPDEAPHGIAPAPGPSHPQALQMAGWDHHSRPVMNKVGLTRIPTADHPIKGYEVPVPVAVKTPIVHHPEPVVVKSVKHHPVKIHPPPEPVKVKSIHHTKIEPHPQVEYHHPIPVKTPVVVESHPEKGHHAAISVKSSVVENVHHSAKTVHHPVPVKSPVIVQRVEHHPEKGYQPPRPVSIKHQPKSIDPHPVPVPVIVERVEHHPKIIHGKVIEKNLKTSHHHHRPAPVVVENIEHYPGKGHQPIAVKSLVQEKIEHYPKTIHSPKSVAVKTPVAKIIESHPKSVHHHHRPAPVVEHHPEKGYQPPRPMAIKSSHAKVEHHPKIVPHHHPGPVPYKAPVIVERLEDHLSKGYQPPRLSPHIDKSHHHDRPIGLKTSVKGDYHVKAHPEVIAPVKVKSYSEHLSKSNTHYLKSKHPEHARIVDKVEYHTEVGYRNGKKVYYRKPVVVSRVEHNHNHLDSRHLPAEHRDVDIVLEPTIQYDGKNKLRPVRPVSIHNIDVHPEDIRVTRAPLTGRHGHEDHYPSHNHDPHYLAHIRDHSHTSEYHANHPPRSPSVTHRHTNQNHDSHDHHEPAPVVVTSISVSSEEMRMHEHAAHSHNNEVPSPNHTHTARSRPVRFRPWSLYSPGSFYW